MLCYKFHLNSFFSTSHFYLVITAKCSVLFRITICIINSSGVGNLDCLQLLIITSFVLLWSFVRVSQDCVSRNEIAVLLGTHMPNFIECNQICLQKCCTSSTSSEVFEGFCFPIYFSIASIFKIFFSFFFFCCSSEVK